MTWKLCDSILSFLSFSGFHVYEVNAKKDHSNDYGVLECSPLIGGAKRGVGEFAFWVWITLTDTTVTSFLVYNSIHRPVIGRLFELRTSLLFQGALQKYFTPHITENYPALQHILRTRTHVLRHGASIYNFGGADLCTHQL